MAEGHDAINIRENMSNPGKKQHMKALIVDDNASDRKLLKLNLEKRGYEIVEAQDGEQGLALALEHRPDLIISDAMMPRMDGFQFLREVRKDSALRPIPFVFYSSIYTDYKEAKLAVSLGADAFISKPKGLEEFWMELTGILEETKQKHGRIAFAEPIKEEEEYLKTYSRIVAAKLEEKVRELEKEVEERKKAENALSHAQKMETIGQFAGSIAHDFNNIISAIANYAYLLQDKAGKDSPLSRDIGQILAITENASKLTQSLLAFSRKQPSSLKPHDINRLIKTLESFLKRLTRENVEFTVQCGDDELVVMADDGQLGQVLMNLVTNANDAMPDGGRLTIKVRKVRSVELERTVQFGVPPIETFEGRQSSKFGEKNGARTGPCSELKTQDSGLDRDYAVISVADTGTGMDEQAREKIFEPFFTTKGPGKGTGLGLSIVYGIVKQHNGHIDVCSEPGKGTVVNIYLPQA